MDREEIEEARRRGMGSTEKDSVSLMEQDHSLSTTAGLEEADGAVWHAVGALEAPPLGAKAEDRIRRNLSMAVRARSSTVSARSPRISQRHRGWLLDWAVVATAILLGLGAGSRLGGAANDVMGAERQVMPASQAGLIDFAGRVFHAEAPGTPAAAWFGGALGGEG